MLRPIVNALFSSKVNEPEPFTPTEVKTSVARTPVPETPPAEPRRVNPMTRRPGEVSRTWKLVLAPLRKVPSAALVNVSTFVG